ncbi:MAG: hypothetical protein KDE27_25670 [Planctomycetes bacterium]|nr:hypothetical protein [Planctomycetota bacterium]
MALAGCAFVAAPRHPRPVLPTRAIVAATPLGTPELAGFESRGEHRWHGTLRGDGETVLFELWSERDPAAPRPLVLLVPMLAGGEGIMDYVADTMFDRGFDVALCARAGSAMRAGQRSADLQELFRRTVLHQRLVLAWLRGTDAGRGQFVLGISLGGMVATAVAAQEPELAGAAICLAGGDLPSLVPKSSESRVRRWLEWRLTTDGVGVDHIRWELRQQLAYEPLALARAVATDKVLFVSADFDDVVPAANQDLLWEALGRPERMFVPFGHYTAALAIGPILSAAADHFAARCR